MDLEQHPIVDFSSDEGEVENLLVVTEDIPDCEGIPRRLWSTKVVT